MDRSGSTWTQPAGQPAITRQGPCPTDGETPADQTLQADSMRTVPSGHLTVTVAVDVG